MPPHVEDLRTQGAIVCVCGVRKWTFKTTTVTHMLRREIYLCIVIKIAFEASWGVSHQTLPFISPRSNLNVSRIMVKRTNLPRRGTTREVGGMISARRRKNTVRESRIEMDKETWGKRAQVKSAEEDVMLTTFSPLSEGK